LHVRAFDDRALEELLTNEGLRAVHLAYLGESVEHADQALRRWCGTRLPRHAAAPPAYAICPICGFHEPAKLELESVRRAQTRRGVERDSAAPRALAAVRRVLSRVIPDQRRYRWVCGVFQRTPNATEVWR
jgi:hypothetical protein